MEMVVAASQMLTVVRYPVAHNQLIRPGKCLGWKKTGNAHDVLQPYHPLSSNKNTISPHFKYCMTAATGATWSNYVKGFASAQHGAFGCCFDFPACPTRIHLVQRRHHTARLFVLPTVAMVPCRQLA
jgi:hypothetical protein